MSPSQKRHAHALRMKAFAREILDSIFGSLCEGYFEVDIDDFLNIAKRHHLVEKVHYNPEIHSNISDADVGDLIWIRKDCE